MTDRLTAARALADLAAAWEDDAGVMEHYDAEDPKAKVLRSCATALRELLEELAPEWVGLPTVQACTGWSSSTLRKRARRLEEAGRARKTSAGEWELEREAALEIAVKDDRLDLEGMTIPEMARKLGRET